MDRAYAVHKDLSSNPYYIQKSWMHRGVPVTPVLGDRDECILKACCLDKKVSFQFHKRSFLSAMR